MRNPAVAGQFYPSKAEDIKKQIEGCFLHPVGPGKPPEALELNIDIIACIVPHAGYVYSGPEAAHVYYKLSKQKRPERVVILGPNHTGYGSAVATSKEAWATPLGEIKVDEAIADFLWKKCNIIDLDEMSHRYEHSIEVQLPFLQYIYKEFKLVPISMGMQDLEISQEIASCLSKLSKIEDTLIIATSDFTHYEPREVAEKKDRKAIENILKMDEKEFINTVHDLNISICGYGPIATCIAAAKKLGAKRAELLKYGTSGDITGDNSSVVAYAGIVFRE